MSDEECLTAPGTRDQLCVDAENGGFGRRIFAVRSGVEIQIWDERTKRGPYTASGRVIDEQPFQPFYLGCALRIAEDVYKAATAVGIPFQTENAATLIDALSRVTFVVGDEIDGVLCRQAAPPRTRKPRKVTQKRLDGGEDMTV